MENWKRIKFVPLTADEYMMLPPNFQKGYYARRLLSNKLGIQKSTPKGPIGPSPLRKEIGMTKRGGKKYMRRTRKSRK